jgi:hypothetical protein
LDGKIRTDTRLYVPTQTSRFELIREVQRAKVELWVKSKSQDFWGPRILGSMNPWSLRSLPPLRPVGRKRVAGMTLKDLKCTGCRYAVAEVNRA